MKTLFIILLSLSFAVQAQNDPVRYNFSTYKGPIMKGWLFTDTTYRKLYTSYNAADSSFKYYQQEATKLRQISNNFSAALIEQRAKRTADSLFQVGQQKRFDSLAVITKKSTELTDKAIDAAKKRVPVIDVIFIGAGTLILGWLAGHVQ